MCRRLGLLFAILPLTANLHAVGGEGTTCLKRGKGL